MHLFSQLTNKHFLLSLYLFLSNAKLSKFDFTHENSSCLISFIRFFVKYLLVFVTSMDDVEFIDAHKSFQKDVLAGIVVFLNTLVYELIRQNGKKKMEVEDEQGVARELRESAVLLINDLYHKNFRTKLLPNKTFEMPKLNHELI